MAAFSSALPNTAGNLAGAAMYQNKKPSSFMMTRELNDRRVTVHTALPYITEEGLVLVDRRECGERRMAHRQYQASEPLQH